jgi:hypothetical protein
MRREEENVKRILIKYKESQKRGREREREREREIHDELNRHKLKKQHT